MATKQVKCRSGLTGWQAKIQDNYADFEEWRTFAEMYGLHRKLGFDAPDEAWEANPVIQGSVEPSDFCKIENGKRCFFNPETGEPEAE
jgi:hypothetical protein